MYDPHEFVTTDNGSYRILPDTAKCIPIHYVSDAGVLMPDGQWTVDALEDVIGTPGTYASRTVRVFVVLPELGLADLRIPELVTLLRDYADDNDLNVKLTYYPDQFSAKERINTRINDPKQPRISIDILGREIINELRRYGHAGIQVMSDMHLTPGPDYDHRGDALDTARLFEHPYMRFPRNEEYDYNTVIVHTAPDGAHACSAHRISAPTPRDV